MSLLIPKIEYGSLFATAIEFDYPAVEDDGDQLRANATEAMSLTGIKQTKLNYIEAVRPITLSFVNESLVAALQTFLVTHAALGKSFRYYDDKDENDYKIYELMSPELPKKRITYSGGQQGFIYTIKLTLRRIINSSTDLDIGESMTANILNNQSSPLSIAGLDFSGAPSGRVAYTIVRNTDANSIAAQGEVRFLKKDGSWLDPVDTYDSDAGEDHGVTFSITSGGQVQYESTNMAGSDYVGTIYFREMKGNG